MEKSAHQYDSVIYDIWYCQFKHLKLYTIWHTWPEGVLLTLADISLFHAAICCLCCLRDVLVLLTSARVSVTNCLYSSDFCSSSAIPVCKVMKRGCTQDIWSWCGIGIDSGSWIQFIMMNCIAKGTLRLGLVPYRGETFYIRDIRLYDIIQYRSSHYFWQ